MQKLRGLLIFLGASLIIGCGKPNRFPEGWDRGGTLHDVSLREWAFATDANRLATSADFMRELGLDISPDVLKLSSALFEQCLTESSYTAAVDFIPVRSKIDRCLISVQQIADRMAREL